MADLKANENTHYALRPYRDSITVSSKRELQRQIEVVTAKYGDFCHVRPRPDQGKEHFDIAVSDTPGYLLGDTVAKQLGFPRNLLWCEETGVDSETGEILVAVVIIREGRIELDANMPTTAVSNDIGVAIMRSDEAMDVYIHGNVPVVNPTHEGRMTDVIIDPVLVDRFHHLEEGLFGRLEPTSSEQLKTPTLAIKDSGLTSKSPLYAGLAAIVLGAVYFGFVFEPPKPEVTVNDPFLNYRAVLASPEPALVLADYYLLTTEMMSIPGWVPSQLDYSSVGLKATFRVKNASTTTLVEYAKQRSGTIKAVGKDLLLNISSFRPPRAEPKLVSSLQDLTNDLIDRFVRNPRVSLRVGEVSNHGSYRQTMIVFIVSNALPQDLLSLADAADGYPMVLENGSFRIDKVLMSGQLTFNLYGI